MRIQIIGKKVSSLVLVAFGVSQRGKAKIDGCLRGNIATSRLTKAIEFKTTIRNLIHPAEASLPYKLSSVNSFVSKGLASCVQGVGQLSLRTAFQKDPRVQKSNNSRHKTCKNLRTVGSNLNSQVYLRGRSFHSRKIFRRKDNRQPFTFVSRQFAATSAILLTDSNERVTATNLTEMVNKQKNKDSRYGNLIQIISDISTLRLAYSMIKDKPGNNSKGTNEQTLDGISLKYLEKISLKIKSGNFKFSPSRRILISKPGKDELRPLSISNSREKIVHKAIEIVLTAIYKDVFLDCSHGSRHGRNCHSAIKQLQLCNASTFTWIIKGNIKACSDNIPHSIIIKSLRQQIDCPATEILIKNILNAGYILDKDIKKVGIKNSKIYKTAIGTPKGSILSPLFNNITLHSLDIFIENKLGEEYNIGKSRKANLKYRRFRRAALKETNLKIRRKKLNQCLRIPSKDFYDPNFKRISYVRYVGDLIILLAGSYKNALDIRHKISEKLQQLGLTLNMKKTKITSLRRSKCRFLGFDLFIRKTTKDYNKPVVRVKKNNSTIRQRFSPRLIVHAPILHLLEKLKEKRFVKRSSKSEFFPKGKSNCTPLSHPQILNYFNSRIRGILNYYSCVHNRMRLWAIVRFLIYSCALTLAKKYKLKTLAKTFKKFGKNLSFENKVGKVYKIYRPKNLRILSIDERFSTKENTNIDKLLNQTWSSSLTSSQFDEPCAICCTTENIEIHHIRPVKNVRIKVHSYSQWVGGYERKTVPLCNAHHLKLHAGSLTKAYRTKFANYKGRNITK